MQQSLALLTLALALPILIPALACRDDARPGAGVAQPPVAWIYDGVRLLRHDLGTGASTRERLPGASLPLDDAAPDGATGLEGRKPARAVEWLLPSPDDRFLVYGLQADQRVDLHAWDRQAGVERSLGAGPWWAARFLDGPPAILAASSPAGITLFDLAAGRSGTREGRPCEFRVAGSFVLAEFPTGAPETCGDGAEARVLSWDGGTVVDRPLVLPWTGAETFVDTDRASVSEDGQALTTVYRRTEPQATQHPLVLCDLPAARCEALSDQGRIDLSWAPSAGARALSRDGRTLAFRSDPTSSSALRVVADGVGRDVDPGEIALALHAADDAQVFVLTGVGPVSDPTGQRLAAIDARDGTIRSLWAADRSAWLPLAFDVAEGRDRLLLTEYEYESGTDVIQFFARQARLLDPETGVLGDRVGGGGVPVVADRSLRRVLMSQARGPAGHVLASGDPAGTLAPIAHWKGSPDAFLRVSSSACGGACPLGECRAGAALHAAPSVTLDGASYTYAVDEDVAVVAVTDPTDAAPGVLEVVGPSGPRRFTVVLPPPHRLPLAVGESVHLVASRSGSEDDPPRIVFAAWDDQGLRLQFLGGSRVTASPWGGADLCAGRTPCATIGFGNTGCAPEPLQDADCGPVDHPPIVFAFPQPGWPIQAEQGGSATGEGGIRMTVFASTRPVDGPCPALGPGIAYVLFTMEPR